VHDPDGDPVSIAVTAITQDGALYLAPCEDGAGVGTATAELRAVRNTSRGRVYRVTFEASDGRGGVCTGSVNACVPGSGVPSSGCVQSGTIRDSTAPGCVGVCREACTIERSIAHGTCGSQPLPNGLADALERLRNALVRVAGDGYWEDDVDSVMRNLTRSSQSVDDNLASGAISASCAASLHQILDEARADVLAASG
jgi:hypothetical protein